MKDLMTGTLLSLGLLVWAAVAVQAQGPNPPVRGAGTAGQIPLWITSNRVADSDVTQDPSGDIGIGTTTPSPFGSGPTRWIQFLADRPQLRLTGLSPNPSDFYILPATGLLDRRTGLGTADASTLDFVTNGTSRLEIPC